MRLDPTPNVPPEYVRAHVRVRLSKPSIVFRYLNCILLTSAVTQPAHSLYFLPSTVVEHETMCSLSLPANTNRTIVSVVGFCKGLYKIDSYAIVHVRIFHICISRHPRCIPKLSSSRTFTVTLLYVQYLYE